MPSVQLNTDLINARIKHILDAWNVSLVTHPHILYLLVFPQLIVILRARAEMMNMSQYLVPMEYYSLQETREILTILSKKA